MESAHPHPIEPGGRTLAAIVFTDVVSFSGRMRKEEVPTLLRLEEDFAVMRKCCEQYSGAVLKSTGDGLMLSFKSAVQAVRCALAMQRHFAARARENPEDEPLVHRVGLHLGDVFATEQDVMGDGVNVAARLQAAADPGGICISQTVLDVVRNKLEIDVDRLMPRDIKNAAEIGPMYRVLLVPRPAAPAAREFQPAAREAKPLFSAREKTIMAAVFVAALGIAATYLVKSEIAREDNVASSAEMRAKIDQELTKLAAGGAGPAAAPPVDRAAAFDTWLQSNLARRTQRAPLQVTRVKGVYSDGRGGLVFFNGGASRPAVKWSSLAAADRRDVIVAALQESPVVTPEILAEAEAYAAENNVEGLAEAVKALERK